MIWCRLVRDRRGAHRPSNGDRRVCPRCGGQSLEFSDRYRITGASGVTASTPAWACDRAGCGYCQPVRRATGGRRALARRRMAHANLPLPFRKKSS